MLVWGGSDNGNSLFDGAAYNPTTNTWRQLPTNTLAATVRPTVAWTGTEMIVLEGANGSPRGAAFNPVTNSWRPIANPPGRGAVPYPHAVWTGTEMVTTLSKGPGDSPIIAAYDPQDDTWEELPIDLGSGQRPNLVWTGTEVLAFGMTDVPGRAWNPATKTWRALAVAPPHRALGSQPVWTGHLAVFCNGGPTLSIYDPTADTWSTSPTEALSAERVDGAAVWTGTTLLAWGGFVSNPDGTAAGANDGVAWTQRQG
jgi:hypothetical protein